MRRFYNNNTIHFFRSRFLAIKTVVSFVFRLNNPAACVEKVINVNISLNNVVRAVLNLFH